MAVSLSMLVGGLTFASFEKKEVKAAGEYQLVWSDEFNGTALNTSNWNIEENGNGGGNNERQYYTKRSQNLEVSNGTLKIHALKENYGGKQYTSGRINTNQKQYFKYGKFEAKMKLPSFSGAWPAFWTLGNNYDQVGWPACGEMDIMEAINTENKIYANLHWSYKGTKADTKTTNFGAVNDRTQWHVYGMIWDKDVAKFYIDSEDNIYQTYQLTEDGDFDEFRKAQFIILNLAIGGDWPGNNIDNNAFPNRSTMEVDYVRVYQKKEPVTETYYIKDEDTDMVAEANAKFTTFAAGLNSWAGDATFSSNTEVKNGTSVNVSNVGNTIWALQSKSPEIEGIAGNKYHLSTTLTSSINKKTRVKIRGNYSDNQVYFDRTIDLQAGVPYVLEADIRIPNNFDGHLNIDYGYGNYKESGEDLPTNTAFTFTISNTTFVTHKTFYGSRIVDEIATQKSSIQNESNNATEVITSQNGSIQNESNANIAVAKTKVKTAKKIKKAKKIKISLKKVTGATGYQLRFSKKKSFKKKNIIANKTIKKAKLVKKAKFTIKHKKFNNKKIWVKARAFKVNNGNTVYSKWTKAKKVK